MSDNFENRDNGEQALQENTQEGRKLSGGRKIAAINALVLALVLILNILVSVIGDIRLWYVDLSRERYKSAESALYTLSEECISLVEEQAVSMIRQINDEKASAGEDKIKLNIIFCADKDFIEQDDLMRYISFTARALAKEFPDCIDVKYINTVKNPSAVQKYKTNSAASIYTSDVIVEFGSEYIVRGVNSFYYTDTGESAPWAYNGEQGLASMMMSVTRAEAPICAITNNHGETLFDGNGDVKDEYSAFVELIGGAGYEVEFIDLEKEEIPENCRMIITFNPMIDFKAYGNLGENNVSEIEKLDKYLDQSNAFFYICDRTTPKLKNLEEYLEEWGIAVNRLENKAGGEDNIFIRDAYTCVDGGKGEFIIGSYVTEGLGAALTSDMRKLAYPAKVVFGNSTSIVPAENYVKTYVAADAEKGTAAYNYYRYYKNGISRGMMDVFVTSKTAEASIDGSIYEIATEYNRFKLMTVTREERVVQESNLTSVNQASYVLSLASTSFLSNEVLSSTSYGNTDVVLSALRNTSRAVVPTNIDLKAFYVYEIADDAAFKSQNTEAWTSALAIIPAVLSLAVGIFVTVRRKYR